MATHARQQYFADEVSLQKDSREFSIADEVQQKIDGIEEGAQVNVIETVKVNGEPLTPDEDKAVDITVPGVIDNLYSTSVSDALSARQGKVLYDYLQNIASRGRYLSNWNCATGLAMTNPEESPYEYRAGDYYTVSDVAALGGTNYRPDGSEYIIGQASTVVETEDVSVSDLYLYDGTNWLLLSNSGRAIAVDSSLSTTSTNPVENRVITNALNNKADATDVNTKTFRVTGTNDLVPFQAAYDYFLNGGWPIIIYGYSDTPYQGAYVIDRTSNVFQWSRTEQWYYSNSTESFACYVKLRPQLSGSTVTGMQFIFNSDTGYLDLYTNYGAPYTPLYDGSPATKKYVDDHAGTTYTAGTNVQISAQNVISATDTTYTEGTGIDISNANVISADTTVLATKADLDEKQDLLTAGDNITIEDECYPNTKGPCPKGFHIGMQSEWRAMITAYNNLGLTGGSYWIEYLHLPRTDDYDLNAYYWCADTYGSSTSTGSGSILTFSQNGINAGSGQPTYLAHPIRPVKDTPETPDSSWTTVYDGSSVASGAGIFYNATLGLISISSDGTTWYTIADKNLGATTVYDSGDTRSQANCGNRFQWGNCYGFSWSGETVDSTTPVDTTGYGPGNYYYSDVFMGTPSEWSWDWSSPGNRNLWGGDNPSGTQCALTISAQVPEIEVDDEISSISENPVQNKVIKEALDEKVNLGLNRVFDSTTVEIGKWEQEGGMSSSGHHVTIDPSGEVSTYNVTTGGHNEATLGSGNLTLLENSVLGGDETTVISQDGITVSEGQTTKTYNFLGNDRIATLSDISGGTTQWGNIVGNLGDQTDLTTYIDSHDTIVSATAPSNPTEGMVWYDTTNDALKAYNGTSWETEGTKMVVLEYGVSTWQDFLDAYNKNALVYCKVSSGSSGYRMAFMAYTAGSSTPTEVEFQYYRSRSSHSTAANQLDEVYVYKLTNAGVWTTTQRDTAAKAIAGTGIGLSFSSSGMTISADTSVLATKADIADFGGFEVVATLPATGETNIIYLLGPIGTGADKYEEWIYASSTWTKIGETSVDLSDLNTKTFYLSDTTDLTTAQEAVDWLLAGKNPIVKYSGYSYLCVAFDSQTSLLLVSPYYDVAVENNSVSKIKAKEIYFSLDSNNEVTAITAGDYRAARCLSTDIDYPTPYNPQYAGSPATKKYVDDSINTKTFDGAWNTTTAQDVYDWIKTSGHYAIVKASGDNYVLGNVIFSSTNTTTGTISSRPYLVTHNPSSTGILRESLGTMTITVSSGTVTGVSTSTSAVNTDGIVPQRGSAAPSSPVEGTMWYDTTNDVLKVYDGTNWNEFGSGAGDMLYADFNWKAKTGATVTLDLASTVTPESDFTINAPSTIRDGQTYILRVNNGAVAYTMTLGTNITNPYQESILLTAGGIDQFVFLAVGGNLELQPQAGNPIEEYVESINGTSGTVNLKTVNSTSIVGSGNIAVQATLSNITAAQIKTGTATTQRSVTAAALAGGLIRISDAENNILANGGKLWAGTQEDYEALASYDENTVYLTI